MGKNDTRRPLVGEFLGTFTLVFIGTAVATLQGFLGMGPAGWLGISFAFGGTLAVLVWVVGPVSGCHLNPAVTLPMFLSGRIKGPQALAYVAVQLFAAAVASSILLVLLRGIPEYTLAEHGLAANGNPTGMGLVALVGWELIMTALFLYTILAVTRKDAFSGFAAPAIGGYLFLAHLVGAPLGDASLNPARSFGPALIEFLFGQSGAITILWVFLIGPILGGLAGWGLYILSYNEK